MARSLSLAGRVTLAVSVLAAVPTFFKQTTRLLASVCSMASVCSKIDKIIRGFIWGSTNGNGIDVNLWDDTWVPSLVPLRSWSQLTSMAIESA
ncbi:hypothetical protein V6N11_021548 [Hibiscus sabdariffa]|uniref:Uncharacterized protein n=2 Tax=Hibiscus sabdariffa TaxID=183260 RepID=A0ABR2C3M8_9ROSI